ncbi:beta-hydroxyacyl-ACP dehydratase [Sphaerisporangium melleum]|uniref:Beta-hydroxyacyl-ACP dehydratase n=1 Tax=Sphaerisporangium melleum TaxID=321316 RepID=A0A917QWB2_9ACTN|nr:MaoC/PaaZ C-terminal domain-containing protein [Sphaerisporangium melleum]GGK71408.1 beta-hydroxyacyl-ACP dehydratase [Sphaerisporangium melleum]GII70177.1 beta-hydroxyacyl-ACP dehydratase [Sphaerisporangium melleum]
MRTLSRDDVETGAALPPLRIELTPTTVIATALATMDYTPVHHDVQVARAQGSAGIFLNILTTMGLVQRYVTDWAGPEALVRCVNVRLGVPAYAGDTLTFGGTVTGRAGGEVTVEVRGAVSLGDHAIGTVRLTLPH